MSCTARRINYKNRPSYAAETQLLESELRKILMVDTDLEFRFDVTFIASAGALNNFQCKVYPYEGDDHGELLGTLQRGDEEAMREIKRTYNGC